MSVARPPLYQLLLPRDVMQPANIPMHRILIFVFQVRCVWLWM